MKSVFKPIHHWSINIINIFHFPVKLPDWNTFFPGRFWVKICGTLCTANIRYTPWLTRNKSEMVSRLWCIPECRQNSRTPNFLTGTSNFIKFYSDLLCCVKLYWIQLWYYSQTLNFNICHPRLHDFVHSTISKHSFTKTQKMLVHLHVHYWLATAH